MIVFDLQCGAQCGSFEAWFGSNSDFEEQRGAGLVECPVCQSTDIRKAPMAPRLPKKVADTPISKLAALQGELLKNSRWVGDEFTDTARAMHLGEIEQQQVHGNATLEQARSLADEGIPVAPLPLPVTPPSQVN